MQDATDAGIIHARTEGGCGDEVGESLPPSPRLPHPIAGLRAEAGVVKARSQCLSTFTSRY